VQGRTRQDKQGTTGTRKHTRQRKTKQHKTKQGKPRNPQKDKEIRRDRLQKDKEDKDKARQYVLALALVFIFGLWSLVLFFILVFGLWSLVLVSDAGVGDGVYPAFVHIWVRLFHTLFVNSSGLVRKKYVTGNLLYPFL
jgi:hypothetical protein